MTTRNRNALIGLFVLGSLICLAALIILFGEGRGFFSEYYTIDAQFDSIIGVRQGTDVHLAGVWVGKVQKVELVNREVPSEGARAILEIRQDYSIPAGSVAEVQTPILGQPIINITPPLSSAQPLPYKDGKINGVVKNPLETAVDPEFIDSLQTTTEQIRVLARSLNYLTEKRYLEEGEVVDAERLTPNLYSAIVRLHNVLTHFDEVLGDPEVKSNVRVTVENFRKTSERAQVAIDNLAKFGQDAQAAAQEARQVLAKAGTTLDSTHTHIDDLSDRLAGNLDQVSRFLDYMTAAARDMAEGQGTVGMLLRDPKFYDSLILTVERIGKAAEELKVLVIQWQREGLISSFQTQDKKQ